MPPRFQRFVRIEGILGKAWCYNVTTCRLGDINVLRRIGRLGQIPGLLWWTKSMGGGIVYNDIIIKVTLPGWDCSLQMVEIVIGVWASLITLQTRKYIRNNNKKVEPLCSFWERKSVGVCFFFFFFFFFQKVADLGCHASLSLQHFLRARLWIVQALWCYL